MIEPEYPSEIITVAHCRECGKHSTVGNVDVQDTHINCPYCDNQLRAEDVLSYIMIDVVSSYPDEVFEDAQQE